MRIEQPAIGPWHLYSVALACIHDRARNVQLNGDDARAVLLHARCHARLASMSGMWQVEEVGIRSSISCVRVRSAGFLRASCVIQGIRCCLNIVCDMLIGLRPLCASNVADSKNWILFEHLA
jgi:hypothetical protein